jgi:predicted enzyme related to lactoylglutathione lyase
VNVLKNGANNAVGAAMGHHRRCDMEYLGHFNGGDFYTSIFGSREAAAKRTGSGVAAADFIRVPSIEECVERIERLGGQVVVPKKAVPGAGYFAVCRDTENRAFGLWQDKESIHS